MSWAKKENEITRSARKFARWDHSSGWSVIHCGHPTANWPYFLGHGDRPETIVSFNGLGFKSAAIGRFVVERILAGQSQVTTEDCVPGIARVAGIDAHGEVVNDVPNLRR